MISVSEMLGYLVLIDHLADADADLTGAAQRLFGTLRMAVTMGASFSSVAANNSSRLRRRCSANTGCGTQSAVRRGNLDC